MSKTFKVKKGLSIEPVDPSSISNPRVGDIIVDVNDGKLKKYNESTNQFEEISGSGSGGGDKIVREKITSCCEWIAPEGVTEIKVVTEFNKFVQISTGYNHSLAIDNQGQAWSWGIGACGRLGDGTTDNKCVPVQVCGDHCFTQVSAGGSYSLAIDHQGQAWAWGNNQSSISKEPPTGQLGDGTTDNKCVPVQVCGDHCFVQVSAGCDHSLAIDNLGQTWSWGSGNAGRLGDGTTDNKCIPVQVCGGHCFVQVNAGSSHSLAIDHQGQAWSWGIGVGGRLGDGTETDKCVPVQVCGGHCFVQVNTGGGHSLAIDNQGQAWSWGNGSSGRLGDGTTGGKCVPVQVCGGHCFTQINAGGNHSLAIDNQGQAWSWGIGACDQLGDGTTDNKCVPVQVCGDHCFTQVSAGGSYSLAIDHQGQAWSWGLGSCGRLGDGTTDNKCIPVQTCSTHGSQDSLLTGSLLNTMQVTPGNTYTFDPYAGDGTCRTIDSETLNYTGSAVIIIEYVR